MTALIISASLVGVVGPAAPSQALNGSIISIPGNSSFPFATARVVATQGSAVVFRNFDTTQHNVIWLEIPTQSPYVGFGGSYTFRWPYSVTKKKGRFNFICGLHHAMTGQLIVK